MARTTDTAVKGIISVTGSADLIPFIETAGSVVDAHCLLSDYDDTKLELIERWLAAHFYAIQNPRAASQTARGVGQSLQHAVKVGLAVTTYGQQAILIDSAGSLGAFDKALQDGRRQTVSVSYVGGDVDYGS